jgi:hypothetical protein
MEKFEFNVDMNTPYVKIIRFLGAAAFGFMVGGIIVTVKLEGTIDWMISVSGIMCSLFMSVYPEIWKKQSLTIDEEGIYLNNYTFGWDQKKEITWEKVKGVGVKKNAIEFQNSNGIREKISLPVHTESQIEELRAYLKQMTNIKELEYIK